MNDQPISTLMQLRTLTVSVDDSIRKVEAFLAVNRLSWTPVVGDHGVPVGVISAADLIKFHATNGDPDTAAWRLCTYKPLSVAPDASISAVAQLMVQNNVHHVVVQEGGNLRGVVSSLDLVRTLA
jgi:predicted transcriptional regulator